MKTIVMLPLDERPCNFDYPQMMPQADYKLILPPKDMMGDKKCPADTTRLRAWLVDNIVGADACILSLDTLIYGGIVPSRLHAESAETLKARAETVRELRRLNATVKIYAFQLIMRCPDYNSADEEPDYYEEFGRDLHLYGRYTHLEKLGRLGGEDRADFSRIKETVPESVLNDYIDRRQTNLKVLMHSLKLVQEGIVDFFIVPQDDAAVYGFTSMDQMTVREFFKQNRLHMKTAMYPSADDTGLILLGRAVAALNGVQPKIYVHYASTKAERVIPWFEDRPLGETVKYHILSVGGCQVYSLDEADILLAVNMGSAMRNADDADYATAYDIERNLAEFVQYLRYALEKGKIVAVGDVATCNGSDGELLSLLSQENLLLRIHAYAGWNTSSNTLGTAVCQAVHWLVGKDEKGRVRFLLHRYYEDMGYMSYTRKYVTEKILPALGLDYFHADGKNGRAADAVCECLQAFMRENFPELVALVESVCVALPWSRMFEADIRLKLKES